MSILGSGTLIKYASAHLAHSDAEDGTEVDEDWRKFLLGLVDVNMIGLQCYNGRVSDFKMVQLIQERQRPDDVFTVLPLCLMKKHTATQFKGRWEL